MFRFRSLFLFSLFFIFTFSPPISCRWFGPSFNRWRNQNYQRGRFYNRWLRRQWFRQFNQPFVYGMTPLSYRPSDVPLSLLAQQQSAGVGLDSSAYHNLFLRSIHQDPSQGIGHNIPPGIGGMQQNPMAMNYNGGLMNQQQFQSPVGGNFGSQEDQEPFPSQHQNQQQNQPQASPPVVPQTTPKT
jgi:hypothetical protein